MTTWLLDTGPIIAYLLPRDPDHERADKVLNNFQGQLVTTGAVVTEAMHFFQNKRNAPNLFVEFIRSSEIKIIEYCQVPDLQRAADLIAKYEDTPMDFTDATLVLLAETLNQSHICTLDRRGFRTFRTMKGKHFTLVMDD